MIFSSRTIPGNEKAVGRVINGLVRQGIEVITDRTHLVHVSGHPRRAEMEELYRLGAAAHRRSRCTARRCISRARQARARAPACGEVVLCGDGDLVRLAPDAPASIDEVPAARLYKDGALLIAAAGAHGRRPAAARASPASWWWRWRSTTRARCSPIRRSS